MGGEGRGGEGGREGGELSFQGLRPSTSLMAAGKKSFIGRRPALYSKLEFVSAFLRNRIPPQILLKLNVRVQQYVTVNGLQNYDKVIFGAIKKWGPKNGR
jgi:hypothetical protein